MPNPMEISHVSLKIDGAPASPTVMADVTGITVDHSLHLPSMFSLHLYSHDMKWLEDPTFREGKKVEIYFGERPAVKLLSGKIAALEPDLDEAEPTLVVRGYDLAHQLYRGRQRRSFTQVTDSDLARKLASEVGLRPGTIDSTSEVHEYVFQNNQTNAEFLLERAQRLGFELWVEDDALHFRKPSPNGLPVRLAWGKSLRGFRPRLSTAEQVNEVEVRGWDPKRKQEVVGHAQRGNGAPSIGVSQPGADIARQAWGEAKVAVVDQHVLSPADADALAQAKLDELTGTFVEAEGVCDANPDVVPGRQVEITGVGARFGGTYYVTRVLHEWTRADGMTTTFWASGRRDRGVWTLLEEAAPRPVGLGLVIGVVTNNKDPEEMGRIRVKFPWLSDQDESAWARVVSPMAGGNRGLFSLPEIDDEVLVGFDHGDIHRPFILGALWNGLDATPLKAGTAVGGDGKVNQRVLQSRTGHTVTLDDTDGKQMVTIKTQGSHTISLDDTSGQAKVTIKSNAGHTLTLDDTAGGEQITIVDKTGQNQIVFHSTDNSMQIKVQGDLTISAQGKVSITGTAGVEVSSPAQLKLSGDAGAEMSSTAQLKLSGTAGAELSTPAQLEVKGTMVNVEGAGPVAIKGLPIQLN